MSPACSGRYEARDHGLDRPWTSAVVTDDGTWLELPGRSDAERAALVGRRVEVHGVVTAGAIAATAVLPAGPLPLEDPVPLDARGPRTEVEVVETSLEMHAAPAAALAPPPAEVDVRACRPSVRYYRYLYDAVGAPWHWWNRKRWSDQRLATYLAAPTIAIHVLHAGGTPVGYAELERGDGGSTELVYFGLVPEATGRGLGRWFLAWTIAAAWRDPAPRRLWVHTCTLDGPAALPTYRKLGFTAFKHDRFRQVVVPGAPPC